MEDGEFEPIITDDEEIDRDYPDDGKVEALGPIIKGDEDYLDDGED